MYSFPGICPLYNILNIKLIITDTENNVKRCGFENYMLLKVKFMHGREESNRL